MLKLCRHFIQHAPVCLRPRFMFKHILSVALSVAICVTALAEDPCQRSLMGTDLSEADISVLSETNFQIVAKDFSYVDFQSPMHKARSIFEKMQGWQEKATEVQATMALINEVIKTQEEDNKSKATEAALQKLLIYLIKTFPNYYKAILLVCRDLYAFDLGDEFIEELFQHYENGYETLQLLADYLDRPERLTYAEPAAGHLGNGSMKLPLDTYLQVPQALRAAAEIRLVDWQDYGIHTALYFALTNTPPGDDKPFYQSPEQWSMVAEIEEEKSEALQVIRKHMEKTGHIQDNQKLLRRIWWAKEDHNDTSSGAQARIAETHIVNEDGEMELDSLEVIGFEGEKKRWMPLFFRNEGGVMKIQENFYNGVPVKVACGECHAEGGKFHPTPIDEVWQKALRENGSFGDMGWLLHHQGVGDSLKLGRDYDPLNPAHNTRHNYLNIVPLGGKQ